MSHRIEKIVHAVLFVMGISLLIYSNLSAQGIAAMEKDVRMQWWRDVKFGMFIHWGLYSIPAGIWKNREI